MSLFCLVISLFLSLFLSVPFFPFVFGQAERLRRVFQSCGLLAEPILRHRARVARWHRGKEAQLAQNA